MSSWANITDACISRETSGVFSILLGQTAAGQGHPLAAAQCQNYTFPGDQERCQCKMDCLLMFRLIQAGSSNAGLRGYIHLRHINCNQNLFRANIDQLFNNQMNNIQPSFLSRSSGCSVEGIYTSIQ